MGSNKAGKRVPERGQYGNTRGKERQRRRADNRERDPRYQAAMEETRAAQAALDQRMAEEAANPVLGHAEGALLQSLTRWRDQEYAAVRSWWKRMEEAQEREAAIERQPELATVGEASRPKVVFPPTLRSETLRLEGKVCSHDDYVLVRKHKPFDINSVPPKQEGKGWVLGSARQMLIKGYSLAHVIEATGWGKDWFSDIPVDADGYGLGTEAWLESLDKKDKKKGLSS